MNYFAVIISKITKGHLIATFQNFQDFRKYFGGSDVFNYPWAVMSKMRPVDDELLTLEIHL